MGGKEHGTHTAGSLVGHSLGGDQTSASLTPAAEPGDLVWQCRRQRLATGVCDVSRAVPTSCAAPPQHGRHGDLLLPPLRLTRQRLQQAVQLVALDKLSHLRSKCTVRRSKSAPIAAATWAGMKVRWLVGGRQVVSRPLHARWHRRRMHACRRAAHHAPPQRWHSRGAAAGTGRPAAAPATACRGEDEGAGSINLKVNLGHTPPSTRQFGDQAWEQPPS